MPAVDVGLDVVVEVKPENRARTLDKPAQIIEATHLGHFARPLVATTNEMQRTWFDVFMLISLCDDASCSLDSAASTVVNPAAHLRAWNPTCVAPGNRSSLLQ